ncbi:MAG: HIT domain-containing protein [Parachlamydia sp.]|nr:HIT domain-containing protein [Parachlamydia sp.]
MKEDYSEQAIRQNCPHCDRKGFAYEFLLEETPHFCVTCDAHPLCEGHVLIIPKRHTSCIATYKPEEFDEFLDLFIRMSNWVHKRYGHVATFEHGIIGQTVFHSHVHLLPFAGEALQIVPEGIDRLRPHLFVEELIPIFHAEGGYLYFSLGNDKWTVDPALGQPRFFRDRFAKAMGREERANWKETRQNPALLAAGREENLRCSKSFGLEPLTDQEIYAPD